MPLVPFLIMCSDDKNQRKRQYSKITAGSVQNGVFYCKKWSFALDPSGDVSMTKSFLLVLYFNTLHVLFHVEA
jgi:hypothetical protein